MHPPLDELTGKPSLRAVRRGHGNDIARKHGASSEVTTQDAEQADANWPESQPTRYREGWLPG